MGNAHGSHGKTSATLQGSNINPTLTGSRDHFIVLSGGVATGY
jgi:hypothetical protein